MFEDLNGRRVFIATTFDQGFRGTIELVTESHIRLRDFEVATPDPATGAAVFTLADGVARIARTSITWIQEL